MQKLTKLFRNSLLLFLLGAGPVQAQQLAFPGAEGFGKYASGGRGGKVVAVTNLNDDGPGSFRQAFNQFPEEPITIVFRVAGIIDLKSPVRIKRSNVTVAGQTAPGSGITLRGHSFMINGARSAKQGGNHGNIIIRYLRSRPGGTLASGLYGFDMENCQNVIVDHCSFSWANEEVAAMYDTKNVTVQWSIISEGLYQAGHAKGVRAYGGVWGGQNASYHHNLLAHLNSRSIRFNGARAHDTLAVVDYRNNVIYNWGNANAAYGGEVEIPNGKSQVNVVNNYYKPGPGTAQQLLFFQASYTPEKAKGIGQWYVAGNKMEGAPEISQNNWSAVDLSRLPATNQTAAKSPSAFPVKVMLPAQTAEAAYTAVLAEAGAKLPVRDAVDSRIIQETKTKTAIGTGSSGKPGIIDAAAAVGGWPAHKTTVALPDADQDGMPDAWENKYNLNPQDATDGNKDANNNGYTNLEEFLNNQVPVSSKKSS